MPWDHELCAAFYMDPPDEPEPDGWLEEQLGRAAVEDVTRRRLVIGAPGPVSTPGATGSVSGEPGSPLVDEDEVFGRWAGLGVEARDLHLGFFRAVTLVWSAEQVTSAQLDLGDAAVARRLEDWFAEACDRLRPRAGFLITLWHESVEDLVAELGDSVLAIEATGLIGSRADLLYLSGSWFPEVSRLEPGTAGPSRPLTDGVVLGTLRAEPGAGDADDHGGAVEAGTGGGP